MHRSWQRAIALAGALAGGAACDRALRNDSRDPASFGGSFELTLAFEDGTTEATVKSGDTTLLTLALPTSGYRRVADAGTGEVDDARLSVAPGVDLGDPQAGGIAAGTDVLGLLIAAGRVSVDVGADGRVVVAVELDEGELAPFPIGRMTWSFVVRDDIDRDSLPLFAGLTVLAPDRPTTVLALEIPPSSGTVPTGLSLPLDDDGVPLAGAGLPLVLTLRAIPNLESGARFDRLLDGGVVDPARVTLTADRNLGDPGAGGFLAGENLAVLLGADLDVLVDDATGETILALLFPLGGSYPPPLGETTFTGAVLDDEDVASFEHATVLRVETAVTLSGSVQQILTNRCATAPCHDNTFPAGGMRLTNGNTWDETVRVRSGQTPDDSCATLRIDPYFTHASYLLHKINDTHIGDCVQGGGSEMPPGGGLNQNQINAITNWIVQGAHDN